MGEAASKRRPASIVTPSQLGSKWNYVVRIVSAARYSEAALIANCDGIASGMSSISRNARFAGR